MITTLRTANRTWNVDPAHSSVSFAAGRFLLFKIRGSFREFSGRLVIPAGSTTPISVHADIAAVSIDTHKMQRDAYLRSADLLDVMRYPTISFESTAVAETTKYTLDDDSFRIDGSITIRGVTRHIVVAATYQGMGIDLYGNERIDYEARCRLDRRDFGLAGDIVDVTLEIRATAAERW